jgi:hypothetical protein
MLSREWLQAFVPLGMLEGKDRWSAVGAGVLFIEHGVLWLVTALHAVRDVKERIAPLLRKTDGTVLIVSLADVQKSAAFSWLEDGPMDLAATPMPSAPDLQIKGVTRRECLLIKNVIPSMPAYTVGCPYGLTGLDPARPSPLVLDGVVSGTNEPELTIYTSAPTFPGNSGGPLVVHRSPISPTGNHSVGPLPLLFAGIVLAARLVPAPDESSRLPPLHLGIVRSADAVLRLLDSPEARDLASRLKEKAGALSTARDG